MLNCRNATRLLSEQQDHKLRPGERWLLRLHLLICDGCRNFGSQMQTLRQLVHSYVQGSDEKAANPDTKDDEE